MGERPHFSILLENFMLLLRFYGYFLFLFAPKQIHDNAFFQKLQLIFWKKPDTNLTIASRGEAQSKRPPQHCAAAAGAYLVSMQAQTLKSTEVAP